MLALAVALLLVRKGSTAKSLPMQRVDLEVLLFLAMLVVDVAVAAMGAMEVEGVVVVVDEATIASLDVNAPTAAADVMTGPQLADFGVERRE